jgi:DNA-binding transcriptional LysR family regulator
MEWDDFKYFLAVARSGSLTAASRLLKTSTATVGRRIMALETRLGARLFDRGQTGYALTESGEAIRLKAGEIEEAVLSLEREAFGRDLRATGKVRVATAEDIASVIVAPRLAEFRRSHPAITLEIVSSWDVANLTRREADVAIRTVRPTQGDYVIRQTGVWNCALYVAKPFARAHISSRDMSAMPNHRRHLMDRGTPLSRRRLVCQERAKLHLSCSPPIRAIFSMRRARRAWAPRSFLV